MWPNAIINEIQRRRIPTIAGNHDVKAIEISKDKRHQNEAYLAYNIIGKSQIDYLSTLPAQIKLEFQPEGKPLTVMLVHGSPYSNTDYLLEDKDEDEFSDIFLNEKIDILVFGHSHKPYHRILHNGKTGQKYFHAINAGSVGKPKDGNPKCCYVILTIKKNSGVFTKDGIEVQFVRVTYNVEKAALAIEESDLPGVFADMLRKAY
jgi:predicted phosphodiesterase